MYRKTLLGLAAAGTIVLGLAGSATTADAKHRHHRGHGGVNLHLGVPFFFFGDRYYNDGYYYSHRRGNYHCHWVKVKKKHHKRKWVKRCHSRRHHW